MKMSTGIHGTDCIITLCWVCSFLRQGRRRHCECSEWCLYYEWPGLSPTSQKGKQDRTIEIKVWKLKFLLFFCPLVGRESVLERDFGCLFKVGNGVGGGWRPAVWPSVSTGNWRKKKEMLLHFCGDASKIVSAPQTELQHVFHFEDE